VSERLVNADAIAELLDVPATWVREHARANTIPHYKLGRYVRFRVDEVLAWLEECRAGGRPVALRRYAVTTDQMPPATRKRPRGVTPKE
jgi:excisionase family DNA binding protein